MDDNLFIVYAFLLAYETSQALPAALAIALLIKENSTILNNIHENHLEVSTLTVQVMDLIFVCSVGP